MPETLTPQVRGYKSRMVMWFEHEFGQEPETPAGIVIPFNSESLRGNRNKESAETLRGRRDAVRPFDDTLDVSGDFTVPVDAINFGHWLKAIFGEPETSMDNVDAWAAEEAFAENDVIKPDGQDHYFECTTAGTTDTAEPTWTSSEGDTVTDGTVTWTDLGDTYDVIYKHVFTVADVQPSMGFERRYSAPGSVLVYARYGGTKVSTMSLAARSSGELTADIGLLGATEDFEESEYDAGPTEETFLRFQQFQAAIKEGGSSFKGTITEMNMNFNMNLEDDAYTIGDNGVRGDIPEGIISLEGSINALLRNTSKELLDKALVSTETSLELTFTQESGESLSFLFPEIEMARQAPTVEGPRGVRITLPWIAYFDDASEDSSVVVTLKNRKESYDTPAEET